MNKHSSRLTILAALMCMRGIEAQEGFHTYSGPEIDDNVINPPPSKETIRLLREKNKTKKLMKAEKRRQHWTGVRE